MKKRFKNIVIFSQVILAFYSFPILCSISGITISYLQLDKNENFRRIRSVDNLKPVIIVPYAMVANPYFLEAYWDKLGRGIKIDCGIEDILLEIRRTNISELGKELLIVNFVAKKYLKVDKFNKDIDVPSLSAIGKLPEIWEKFLESKNCLYKSIGILELSKEESFDPFSILNLNEKELEIFGKYLIRGWPGVGLEGLDETTISVIQLIAEVLNIGLNLKFIDKEALRLVKEKDSFVASLKDLAQKMLECKEEVVILTPEGESRIPAAEINELGEVIKERLIPYLKSDLGAVISRVIYSSFLRILK